MKILIACEESQVVCKAFRERGHEAYSNDIQDCSGGHLEWHLKMDCFEAFKFLNPDMIIGFPPLHWCKKDKSRSAKRDAGLKFLIDLYNLPCKKIAIENPVGYANTHFKKATQIIEPYYFGDPHRKRTCLWLKGLRRLNGLISVGINPRAHEPLPLSIDSTGKKRYFVDAFNRSSLDRSKTFPGIAKAMAEQWG